MKSSFATALASNKKLWAALIIFGALLLLMRMMSVQRIVQAQGERVLDLRVPEHLPIKIKVTGEKNNAFKDVNNEHWAQDFELEIKNTGDKPIYFLLLVFTLPEVKMPDGNLYGFSLHYGRTDFISVTTSSTPEDIPIKPGESYVLKIPKHQVEGWESYSLREQIPQPKKVEIEFQFLSFGDGTGFRAGGESFDKSKSVGCVEEKNRSDTRNEVNLWSGLSGWSGRFSANSPARFLPAFFYQLTYGPEAALPADLVLPVVF